MPTSSTLVLRLIYRVASEVIEVSLLFLGLLLLQMNQECLQRVISEQLIGLKLGAALRALMLSIDTF